MGEKHKNGDENDEHKRRRHEHRAHIAGRFDGFDNVRTVLQGGKNIKNDNADKHRDKIKQIVAEVAFYIFLDQFK